MAISTEQSTASEIVLLCASTQLSSEGQRRLVELVRSKPDWDAVSKLADRHALQPLLFKQLGHVAHEGVPNDLCQSLRHLANVRAKQNFLFTAELLKLKEILLAQGVEFIAYKGPCLALQAYGDAALRAYNDLDIVIAPDNLSKVRSALRARGYVPDPPRTPPLSESFMNSPLFLRLDHEQSYARYENGRQTPSYVIDLHWQVEGVPAESTMPLLRQHIQELTLFGGRIETVKPELLFFILCVHGTKHQWERISWIVDIAELMKKNPKLNWVEIYRLADTYSVSKMIDLALLLCSTLVEFKCSLPKFVKERLQRSDLDDLIARTLQAWFAEEEHKYNSRNYWLYHLRTLDNFRSRFSFLMDHLCRPDLHTYLRFPLPPYLLWLYCVIRPTFLIFDFVKERMRSGRANVFKESLIRQIRKRPTTPADSFRNDVIHRSN